MDDTKNLVDAIVYKQLYEKEKRKRIALEEEILFIHKVINDTISLNKIESRIPKRIIDRYN